MKMRWQHWLLIGVLLYGIGLSGCLVTMTERKAYLTASTTFRATCDVLGVYYRQGYIDEAKWAKILVWADLADAALDAWQSALVSGDDTAPAYVQFQTLFEDLIEARLETERRKSND